jgi:hypothetical protein
MSDKDEKEGEGEVKGEVKGEEVTLFQCFPTKRCKPEDHDFPSDDQGQITDDAACTKCGMSFIAHIFMEMP